MIKCLGIVNFEDDRNVVEGLDKYRTIAAMSFLGRYRLIDFVLSNMTNSGMDHIKVLVKDKPRSLIDHIGLGDQYNINPKSGSLQLLYSDVHMSSKAYFTDIALMKQYEAFIEEVPYEYVLVAPSYFVCKIDYQDVLKAHIASGAEVTIVYTKVEDGDEKFLNCREFKVNKEGKVSGFQINIDAKGDKNISMETYVMKKETLLKLIHDATKISALHDLKSYLRSCVDTMDMVGYEFKGFVRCINSLQNYYDANIELIDYEKAQELFDPDWPVFTKTNDSTPAYYGRKSKVRHSLISNGAHIHGEVENCIVGRGVTVEYGAKVKNSIILPGVEIGRNAIIEYAILDKQSKVMVVKELVGTKDEIAYLDRREVI